MAKLGTEGSEKMDYGNTKKRPSRSRGWFFTWNNPYLNHKILENHMAQNWDCDYVFQLEKGKKGTKHYQGCIYFKNPRGTNFQGELPKEIHWERCRSWRNAKKYCCKPERIAGPWTNIDGLKIRDTVKDPFVKDAAKEWQLDILKIINGKPDPRKIYWYWDHIGNTGKSTLAKHIYMNYDAVVVYGATKDILYAIRTYLEEDDLKIVIMDIPRGGRINNKVLEMIKNGLCFSGKYESIGICFNSPHVIVFSNERPNTCRFSLDRIVTREVD